MAGKTKFGPSNSNSELQRQSQNLKPLDYRSSRLIVDQWH